MNKFLKLLVFSAFLIASGVVYVKFYRPSSVGPIAPTGHVVEISMHAKKNLWRWEPSTIKVKAGDTVKLKIFNEDDYDHGWALETFGINRRLFPHRDNEFEFVASKAGTFQFYCSVPCGEGHYSQIGTLIVED